MNYALDAKGDYETLFDAVRKGVREADPEAVRPRDWKTVSIALRDSQDAIVGGLYGATMWSWLLIEGLWVAERLRGQGLGRRLLSAGEGAGIDRGCIGAWLGTFDFQAKEFYQRQGYLVFATLTDFPPGHTHFHLRKNFSSQGQFEHSSARYTGDE